jgi:beta-glucosidase
MRFSFIALFLLCVASLRAQKDFPYQQRDLPIEARVADLIGRMSLDEKLHQLFMVSGGIKDSTDFASGLFGYQVFTESTSAHPDQMMMYSAGKAANETRVEINRLQRNCIEQSRWGIPIIAYDEALHGLVRAEATAFPQSIGLAASFDPDLMENVASAIAQEMRFRGLRMVLSPVLNVATDVRWGRTEETYGEDPLLVSSMGLAYIKTMEDAGIVTTPKHFVLNHGDGGRDSYPIFTSGGYLHDTYLRPFRVAIQQGGARSIMTAYNSFLGRPCSSNNWLLNDLLRKKWGFNGFVISDAGATGGANVLHFTATDYADAATQSINNGQDVIFQTDLSSYPLFSPALQSNQLNKQALDSAVAHVLRIKFQLGLFDHPFADQVQQPDRKKHHDLAYEAALKSVVLLRNKNQTLPISTATKKIALIGTDAVECRLGGYSGPGNDLVSLHTGLQKALQGKADIVYAPGCGRQEITYQVIESKYLRPKISDEILPGLHAKYYNNMQLQGLPVIERIDPQIDFQWTLFGPDNKLPYDHYAVEWDGEIISDETGNFEIGIKGNDGYVLYLNDKIFIDRREDQSFHMTTKSFSFEKGKAVNIRIQYFEKSGNARFKLIWNKGILNNAETLINDAVSLSKNSDIILVAAGIEEGEFRDRSDLRLPGRQEELIHRLAATGKPVVVILYGGSAITMDAWIDEVDAILDVWYPGEAGGKAIADLLLGIKNPSGKLPITFPMREGQLPLVYNHLPTGRGDDYVDGSGQALFPFGFGLSYTHFNYDDIMLSKKEMSADDQIEVTFTLTNSGDRDGEEVVQLYLHDEIAQLARPVKELKSFLRVFLKAGESCTIKFTIDRWMLVYSDNSGDEILEPGEFRIMIGSSSKDIRFRETFSLIP